MPTLKHQRNLDETTRTHSHSDSSETNIYSIKLWLLSICSIYSEVLAEHIHMTWARQRRRLVHSLNWWRWSSHLKRFLFRSILKNLYCITDIENIIWIIDPTTFHPGGNNWKTHVGVPSLTPLHLGGHTVWTRCQICWMCLTQLQFTIHVPQGKKSMSLLS